MATDDCGVMTLERKRLLFLRFIILFVPLFLQEFNIFMMIFQVLQS